MLHIGILSQPSNFHCQKWSLALKKAGNQVTVFSLEDYEIPGLACISLSTGKKHWNYQDFFFTRKKLKEALHSEKVDVIHPLHLTPYGVWGMWTGFQPIIPAAMGADVFEYLPSDVLPELNYRHWKNLTQKQSFFYQIKNFFTKFYHKKMVQKVLKHSLYVTADNRSLIEALEKYFYVPAEKLILQRWGIDQEVFEQFSENEYSSILIKYGLNPEKNIVLSPRGLMPIYQGDIILETFSQLIPQYPHLEFVMLSAGYPIPNTLFPKIKALESSYSNFHCIKTQIPREEMAVIWRKTQIFISAPIYDGYSASVAEGRFVGAIPVVNAIPGNLEIIENQVNGIIINPFTVEQLTQNLQIILSNLDFYYQKFRKINQTWMNQYGLLKQDAEKFTNFIQKIF